MHYKLQLSNLNDFLAAEEQCVSTTATSTLIRKSKSSKNNAVVNAKDCLACSGCIEDAELQLLKDSNVDLLTQELDYRTSAAANARNIIVSLSPVVESFFCARFKKEKEELYELLNTKLYRLGIDFVADSDLASEIRFISLKSLGKPIETQCPSALLLCEKYLDDCRTQISTVPSREIFQSTLVKRFASETLAYKRSTSDFLSARLKSKILRPIMQETFSVLVCECFDKKIETLAPQWKTETFRILDLVLTATEFLELFESNIITDFTPSFVKKKSFSVFTCTNLGLVFRYEPRPLEIASGYENDQCLNITETQNDNLHPQLTDSKILGTTQLNTGFNFIEKLIRQKKYSITARKILFYACPSGCFNGSGLFEQSTDYMLIDAARLCFTNTPRLKLLDGKHIHADLRNFLQNKALCFDIKFKIAAPQSGSW